MAFTSEMLSEFIHRRKKEFESIIIMEAKKLTLKQIVSEAEGKEDLAHDIAQRKDYKFKSGDIISFMLPSFLSLELSSNELSLHYETALKTFRGTHVKSLYNKLSDSIEKEIDNYLENLLF